MNHTSSKTTAHYVCSDAQKTRARFKGVMCKGELGKSLTQTRDYFESRGFDEWVELLNNALSQYSISDYSFVTSLWLKFGDTCDVDNLIITEYAEKDEDMVNELNSELSEFTKQLFWVLDKIESTKNT